MTTTTTRTPEPAQIEAPSSGLPVEQVHAWLAHVQSDLRRVRAQLEYLRAEEIRLTAQECLLSKIVAAGEAG
jgi:hypothetical protein